VEASAKKKPQNSDGKMEMTEMHGSDGVSKAMR